MALLATLVVILGIGSYAAWTHYRLFREEEQVNRRLTALRDERLRRFPRK